MHSYTFIRDLSRSWISGLSSLDVHLVECTQYSVCNREVYVKTTLSQTDWGSLFSQSQPVEVSPHVLSMCTTREYEGASWRVWRRSGSKIWFHDCQKEVGDVLSWGRNENCQSPVESLGEVGLPVVRMSDLGLVGLSSWCSEDHSFFHVSQFLFTFSRSKVLSLVRSIWTSSAVHSNYSVIVACLLYQVHSIAYPGESRTVSEIYMSFASPLDPYLRKFSHTFVRHLYHTSLCKLPSHCSIPLTSQ